jgi:hypothetical protein
MVDNLNLANWERMPPKERRELAKRLARELPTGFSFRSLRSYQLGGRKHPVALFEFDGSSFALIPGGSIRLGYDPDRAWEPTPDEQESWEATAEEYGLKRTLPEHIAEVTLKPREVRLGAFLMETVAGEVGWEPIPVDDPEVKKIVRGHFRKKSSRFNQVQVFLGQSTVRVRREADGSILAHRAEACTHRELAARLSKEGFRFPTSDEWEYACGAGAETLFRWGDHVPCDRYPTDISPEEAAWRRQSVLSGGKCKRPAGGFTADWDLHRRPNAFGVYIASDPYKFELAAEPNITRGKDGGCAICGGAGFFVGWLTLATAYFEAHACKRKPKEPVDSDYTIARRVLPLV